MSGFAQRLGVITLGLSLAACQSAPTATSPALGASTAPISSDGPTGTGTAATPGVAATFVTGDGDLFVDPGEGLAGLSSHGSALTWTFTGTADGQASTWSETTTWRTSSDPASSERLVEQSGVADRPARAWTAFVGGVVYTSVGDSGCSAGLHDPAAAPNVEPASQLSALIGGVQTGTETIDGVAADVFQFDGPAMGLVDPITAVGHAWISPADELLRRYDVAIDAGPEYFGDGISGHLEGRYELNDVGASVAIAIPDACPPGLIVGPQPTDASNVQSVPGHLSLQTAMSVKDAMAFYRDTSLAFGWKATIDAVYQADPAVAGLEFSWSGLHLTVVITSPADGSLVEVTANRA